MFYEQFIKLCNSRNVNPTSVATEIGLNKSASTSWKKGSEPKDTTLQKLADYFGVDVSVFDDDDDGNKVDVANRLIENDIILDYLKTRSDYRIMFSTMKTATPEEIMRSVLFLEDLKNGRNNSSDSQLTDND